MKRYWNALAISAGIATLLWLSNCATGPDRRAEQVGRAAADKVKFIDELARFDVQQVTLGAIALRNSQNPEVRRFASQLAEDHLRHLAVLDAWVEARSAELDAVSQLGPEAGVGGSGLEPGFAEMRERLKDYEQRAQKRTEQMVQQFEDLQSLQGAEFDRKFLETVKRSQEKGQKMIGKGVSDFRTDTSFAMLLSKTQPVVQQHLAAAEELEKAARVK